MFRNRLCLVLLTAPLAAIAEDRDRAPLERSWTAALTGGFASTFQMTLGGVYGDGPSLQNKLSVGVNNAFRRGDNLGVFGWSGTDLPSSTANWQAGMIYKTPVFMRSNHGLTVTGGAQRWLLPPIKTGAKDWLLSGNATYSTSVKRVPVLVSGDSWSLLKSSLPTGTVAYFQVCTQHRLVRRASVELALRQGPAYSYSWGFYGAEGNRVFRYSGALILTSPAGTLEAGYRQQVGLQDPIPNNRYWHVLYTRQITKKL